MLAFATEPVPHDEAAKLIADKPALTRDVFDQLPAELQARSFTISGIESFDVLQAVRDRIAELPQGANWDEVKKDIISEISPWMNEEAANKRAELLMRHHAFSAYSAAQAREMDAMADVFPYRQYISTEDSQVRPTHASLNGLILPANHPFWQNHTPPWEWNCRCDVVELTELDYEEEKFRDKKRPVDKRRILEGPALDKLEKEDKLVRGVGNIVDTRTPKQRGGKFEINVRHLTLPYDEIQKRWDPKTRKNFETWADGIELEDKQNSLLGWLTGKVSKLKPKSLVQPNTSNRFSPVSQALQVGYKTKAHLNPIQDAMNAIDEVHDDGKLHTLLVSGSAGSGNLGVYQFDSLNNKGLRLAIKSTGPTPRLTMAHELGHFLDHQGIGSKKPFASQDASSPIAKVMDALEKTTSIEYIKKAPRIDRAYYLDKREIWARAYSQYIAKKSSNKQLYKELVKNRESYPWETWSDEEFDGIIPLIDEAFNKLGWKPKNS